MQQVYSRKLSTKQSFEEWILYEEVYAHNDNVFIIIYVESGVHITSWVTIVCSFSSPVHVHTVSFFPSVFQCDSIPNRSNAREGGLFSQPHTLTRTVHRKREDRAVGAACHWTAGAWGCSWNQRAQAGTLKAGWLHSDLPRAAQPRLLVGVSNSPLQAACDAGELWMRPTRL